MEQARPLTFDHDDRRQIYECVERHGVIERERIADVLRLDDRALRHHLAILKRDGRVAIEDASVRVAIDPGEVESHESADVQYRIRPARQEDLGGIIGVIREVVAAGTYVEAESVAQAIDHEDVLLRFNAHESRMFFVATVNDEVVGWVHIEGSALDKLSHTAELTVGIVEAYRNRGIGSHLISRGLEWAASHGFERIYQSIPATNERAIGFLEEHGWTVEAVREEHYRIDGADVDEVMMAITL